VIGRRPRGDCSPSRGTVAERFVLGTATVKRWVAQRRREGHVEPKPKAGGTPSPIRGVTVDALIAALGDPTAAELTAAYNRQQRGRRRVHLSSMKRALHRHDYVVTKTVPAAGSGAARRPDAATSVPEGRSSDSDRSARLSGRIGRPRRHAPHAYLGEARYRVHRAGRDELGSDADAARGDAPHGVGVGRAADDVCDGERGPLLAWLTRHLLPKLRRGDVLVMDNLRAHHDRRVGPAYRRRGIRVLYLPPYSPDRTRSSLDGRCRSSRCGSTRHAPPSICDESPAAPAIALHPGTVATGLRMLVTTRLNAGDPWD
jgi:transposase